MYKKTNGLEMRNSIWALNVREGTNRFAERYDQQRRIAGLFADRSDQPGIICQFPISLSIKTWVPWRPVMLVFYEQKKRAKPVKALPYSLRLLVTASVAMKFQATIRIARSDLRVR